jgi:tetratricopeptide (TPR) repeat protein
MPRNAGNSAKAERDCLRDRMRGYGCTVPQIAAEMARRFRLRPRVAWRHALGWPQWKLAQQYNTRHPGSRLSDNRVSDYEAWPHGGNPPSLRYLVQLAATYGHGCTPAQLVDADDLAQLTPADRCLLTTGRPPTATTDLAAPTATRGRRNQQATALPASRTDSGLVIPADLPVWTAALGAQPSGDLAALLMACLGSLTTPDGDISIPARERAQAYDRLVQFLTSWAHTMKRRDVLRTLGWAATAASAGHSLNLDEQERLAAVLGNPGRVDAQTIEHIAAVLWRCERQDDALGPQAVLSTVLAQRDLARALLPECPATLRPRMLTVLSNASRHAGWLSFDLNQFPGAEYYYEDARALAHEAENIELSAFALCQMSHLATWQGKPRIGIDHAVAARQWANRTGDLRLRAYSADVAARAYAADRQPTACLTALDAAHTTLTTADANTPSYAYLYDDALHIGIRGMCHLELQEWQPAVEYAQQSLHNLDHSQTRNVAFLNVYLGRAYVQSGEIDEAARLFGEAADIAAHNSSVRLIDHLRQGHTSLQPWQNTAAVRTLNDRLTTHGIA